MGLNETLDRLAKEREDKEIRAALDAELADSVGKYYDEIEAKQKQVIITSLAERIFFQRMLKDINHGMSEPKIDELIDRSVMIAEKLYNRLYR